jgi:ankyrin repeat protein
MKHVLLALLKTITVLATFNCVASEIKSIEDIKNMSLKSKNITFLIAVDESNFSVAKVMLDYGADVNAKAESGKGALHFLARKEFNSQIASFFKVLADKKIDPNYEDNDRITPLMIAVAKENPKTVESLLGTFENIETDSLGQIDLTPLMMSVYRQNYNIAHVLLNYGADASVQNSFGMSALHFLAWVTKDQTNADYDGLKRTITLASRMLANGGSLYAKNNKGKTPLDLEKGVGKYTALQSLATILETKNPTK